MTLVTKKLSVLFGAAGVAALLGGCPEATEAPDARAMNMFDANTGPQIDASPVDAPPADSAPPDQPVAATIAVIDVKITNNLAAFGIAGLSGNVTSITFADPDADEGVVVFGDPAATTGCVVRHYDVAMGQTPPPALNDGAVTIVGGTPATGQCSFNMALGAYVCSLGAGSANAGAITKGMGGTASLNLDDATVAPADIVGAVVNIAGAATAANNGNFPILAYDATNKVITYFAMGAVDEAALPAGATFAIITGASPSPAQRDFLDADENVVINKAAGMTPALTNVSIKAAGEGIVLATDSVKPEAMPLTSPAAALKVSCVAAQGGVCGPASNGLTGFVITARTTDGAVIAAAPPFVMPAPTATGKVATMTCKIIAEQGNIDKAAWDAVLAANPTRIETRILRVGANLSTANTSIAVGHGLVGYTTKP